MNPKQANEYIKKKCVENGLPIITVKLMNVEEQHYNYGLFSPYLIAVRMPVSKATLDHEFREYVLMLCFASSEAKEKMLE